MTDREYDSWQKTLERNVSTRTSLLTFSFTTVLAILGIALSDNGGNINPFAYLVPYLLIIPFEGRIAYYRLIHARISAYLEMVTPQDTSLDIAGEKVPEKQTWFFSRIALLNNCEMLFPSAATAIVFYGKYPFPPYKGIFTNGLVDACSPHCSFFFCRGYCRIHFQLRKMEVPLS